MTVTAVANLKGGVGKTVVAGQLAHAAVMAGYSCLLVDADSQGNSTTHMTGYTADNPPENTLADVLDRDRNLPTEQAIIRARRESIHILPSGFDELQAVQDTLVGKPGGELALHRALKPIRDNYDHILIDCRPAIDLISRGALYTADNVIIVVKPEADAIAGFHAIRRSIDDLAEYMDKDLPIAGVVVNQLDARRNDHRDTLAYLRDYAAAGDIPLLGSPIPMLTDISKLSNVGLGMDQHPKPSASTRVLAENFTDILDAIRTAARNAA